MNNATLVAIFTAAKANLWDGTSNSFYRNRFMCLAARSAIRSIVAGYEQEQYIKAAEEIILARMDNAFTFERYIADKNGMSIGEYLSQNDYVVIQAMRAAFLDDLIAEYQAKVDADAKVAILRQVQQGRAEEKWSSPYVCDNINRVDGDYMLKSAIRDDISTYIGFKFCVADWMCERDGKVYGSYSPAVLEERTKMIATLIAGYEAVAA